MNYTLKYQTRVGIGKEGVEQMKITITKLEGGFAVCKKENQTVVFVNRRDLPFNARDGDEFIVEIDPCVAVLESV